MLTERIREVYATGGSLGVGRAVVRRVLAQAIRYEKHVVLEKPLDGFPGDVGRGQSGAVLRRGGSDDLRALAEARRISHAEQRRLQAKLARGQELVVAEASTAIAGYGFIDRELWRVGGLELRLPPSTVYVDSNFVFPEHRGRGIQQAMLRFMSATSAELGYRRCFALVLSHNRASLRAFRRTGFRPTGRIRVVTLFDRWRSVIFSRDLPALSPGPLA